MSNKINFTINKAKIASFNITPQVEISHLVKQMKLLNLINSWVPDDQITMKLYSNSQRVELNSKAESYIGESINVEYKDDVDLLPNYEFKVKKKKPVIKSKKMQNNMMIVEEKSS